MIDICEFLEQHGIRYQRFDHPAVFTCEESAEKCPPMPGLHTKNLFLRDKKGKRHFLVVVGHGKQARLKELADLLDVQSISFGSPERLREHLGVEPGSVTLLGLVNDPEHRVEVILDEDVWQAEMIGCHPLVNTATLVIPHAGVEKFLAATGHTHRVLKVP